MEGSKKINLILGPGAARGIMHIGVIKKLLERGFQIESIVGISAGAFIGFLYAFYRDIHFIESEFLTTDFSKFIKTYGWKFIRIDTSQLKKYFVSQNDNLPITFRDIPIPLSFAVTNARTGNIEYIYEGDVLDAALASCALPVINKPVRIGTNYYIDGGITLNMPTVLPEHIQNTYPYVGINLANGASFRANKISRVRKDFIAAYANLFKKLNSSIETALDDSHDTKADYQLYELVIDDNSVGIEDFDKIAECIAIGERYTEAKIEELNNLNFAGF